MLVGDVSHGQRVKRLLASHPTLGAELVAVIPFDRVTARGEDADEFGKYLRRSDFHRVIVPHTGADADMIDTIRIFKSRGIKVSVLPSLFDVLGSAVEFDDLGGATLLGVRRYGLTRSSQLIKRALDVVVAGGLLIALAPLFATIAVLIKLELAAGRCSSARPGSAATETRFQIVKFRTMRSDAEERKAELARPQRDARPVQDRRRPAVTARRPAAAAHLARRAAAAHQRPARRDEPGRAAPARPRRGRAGRGLAPRPART